MKTIVKLLFLLALANAFVACEKFPESPEGNALIYLPAAGNGPVLIPGTTRNYRADSQTRMLYVPVFISRSGLASQTEFTTDITVDQAAAQALIDAGNVDIEKTVVAPDELFDLPSTATVTGDSSSFDVVFDARKLEPFLGKQLLLAVRVDNPSAYQMNEELNTLFLLIDVDLVLIGAKTEVTDTFLKNSGAPFIASSRSVADPRRGILADWVTSSSVKNFENGSFGGFDDYADGGFMSMERYGTPEIPNGKIYQTLSLPPARYEMEVQFLDFSLQDEAYFVAAAGDGLPDVTEVGTALAHTPFSAPLLRFEVSGEQEVSLGVVADLIEDFQYFRINKFRLYQYKNIFE